MRALFSGAAIGGASFGVVQFGVVGLVRLCGSVLAARVLQRLPVAPSGFGLVASAGLAVLASAWRAVLSFVFLVGFFSAAALADRLAIVESEHDDDGVGLLGGEDALGGGGPIGGLAACG